MANLSQQKREKLIAFLETLKRDHSDDASLMAIGQIEKELKSKKYGLVWEEHEEEVDVKMRTHIPVFTEDTSREIAENPDSKDYNFLLEGDNLHSLYLLEKTHKSSIDVIYIDPPYNTGKKDDFRYNDAFVVKEDTFRHSKWLSFMAERLKIAKKLLTEQGIIFISIDDNEHATLKLLCDEILGESNYITSLIWQKKKGLRSEARFLSDLEAGETRIMKVNGKWTVHFKQRQPKGYKPRSIVTEYGTTSTGADQLKKIFNITNKFSNPKPTTLIEFLIKFSPNKNATILDFFAGSGTTGHAVLKLNAEDGGHRKFILCTNNENGICENVTYQRLKTVITGKRADGSEYSKGIPANLKYFKTDFVDKESEELSDELLEHIAEMIELEHDIKVDNQKYVMIMTDEEMDGFEKNVADYTELKAVFVSQDILLSANQQKLLDSLTSYVIPNYYFDFELREAGELW